MLGQLYEFNLDQVDLIRIAASGSKGWHVWELTSNNDLVLAGYNHAVDQMLNVSHEQHIGRSIKDIFPMTATDILLDIYRTIAANGGQWKFPIPYADNHIDKLLQAHVFQIAKGFVVASFENKTEDKPDLQAAVHYQS